MKKGLESAIGDLEKTFGKGIVMKFSDKPKEIEVVSTGSPSIDLALGIKGLPFGRFVEIVGNESSGKTSIALQTVAEAQKMGILCAYIDAEHALNETYMRTLGVDVDNMLISQPECAEDTFTVIDTLVHSGEVRLIVLDSLAALSTAAELNGEYGDAIVGQMPRLTSSAMRKLVGPVDKNNVCIIIINQFRQKIGVTYGNPNESTGGKALKYYASVRIEVARIGAVKDGNDIIGNRTKVKVIKNKFSPPFKEVELDLIYGEGFSKEADVLAQAIDAGIIEQKGSWFSYGEERLGQGKENIRQLLVDKPELCDELISKLYK